MKLWIFDMDGVIYKGDSPIKESSLFISRIKEIGNEIVFFTNNSAFTSEYYSKKLYKMGISVNEKDIYTSANLLSRYIKNLPGIKKVLVIGEEGLKYALRKNGFYVTSYNSSVDAVAVGLDRKFNYKKLSCAMESILSGAVFLACNRDSTLPQENGLTPGSGSILKSIEEATGKKAKVIGKPNPYGLEIIMKERNFKKKDVVIVGDRIDTDILMGKKAGVKTILVLTGITGKEEVKKLQKNFLPDRIVPSLGTELLQELE